MAQLQALYPQLRDMGIQVLGVVGQDRVAVRRYLEEHPLPFPLLIDRDRTVIRMYGVYHMIGFDAFNIARPSVFLIDGEGVVRWAMVGKNQWDRPTTEVLLAAAAKLP